MWTNSMSHVVHKDFSVVSGHLEDQLVWGSVGVIEWRGVECEAGTSPLGTAYRHWGTQQRPYMGQIRRTLWGGEMLF